MNKASKLQYKYAHESLDNAIDNLFAIVDVDSSLALEEKEAVLREIWLLVSIKHGMGGK
jgi:hypothetical protein